MKRRSFVMKLKQGCEAEYKKRHDELWPELAEAFRNAGVLEYSIYLDERTSALVAFQTLTDTHTIALLRNLEVVRRWSDSMREMLEVNADGSPKSHPLTEMFTLENRSFELDPLAES
ncbi:MAG: L-rhamnose mutarotase [Verrucomicrobiota bacterium]